MDIEPFTLMTESIESTHYELAEGDVLKRIDDTKWQQEVQPLSCSRPSELVTPFKVESELSHEATEKMAENAEFAEINIAQALASDAYYQFMMATSKWKTSIQQSKHS